MAPMVLSPSTFLVWRDAPVSEARFVSWWVTVVGGRWCLVDRRWCWLWPFGWCWCWCWAVAVAAVVDGGHDNGEILQVGAWLRTLSPASRCS